MAIQISGTNVIDNDKNLVNAVNITASGTISGDIVATQAQAETGTDNTKLMTPLRVAEAITALGGSVINRIQKGATAFSGPANVNVPITSVDTTKTMLIQATLGNHFFVGPSPAQPYDKQGFGPGTANLPSSTQVTFSAVSVPFNVAPSPGDPGARIAWTSGTIEWQVVEFK